MVKGLSKEKPFSKFEEEESEDEEFLNDFIEGDEEE
jgi:hypothetical protein